MQPFRIAGCRWPLSGYGPTKLCSPPLPATPDNVTFSVATAEGRVTRAERTEHRAGGLRREEKGTAYVAGNRPAAVALHRRLHDYGI